MKITYSLCIASVLVASLFSACQPEVVDQATPTLNTSNAQARTSAKLPNGTIINRPNAKFPNGQAVTGGLHLFIKINDIAKENGSQVYVVKDNEVKIQPWYWALDSNGNRFEWEANVPYWTVPAQFNFTTEYRHTVYDENGQPFANEVTGARGYTYVGTSSGYKGELRLANGYEPYAYVNINALGTIYWRQNATVR